SPYPALFTRTSKRPVTRLASSTACRHPSLSAGSSRATLRRGSLTGRASFRVVATTCCPPASARLVSASPRPLLAPVMSQVCVVVIPPFNTKRDATSSFYTGGMARPETVKRVHAAVMALADRGGPGALTMEGIAAEARVGKQTLYRSWLSVHAILFDALAGESAALDASADDLTVIEVLRAAIDEISTEPRSSLLRMLAASIQT